MHDVKPGIYRHFKGKQYKVLCCAQHTEDESWYVVYQAMYEPYGYFIRPIDMFLSEVDHEKYPEVNQKYRFEFIGTQEV